MTVVVRLKIFGKWARLKLALASARRCFPVVSSVFFTTRFEISSGPGALLGATLLIALSTCVMVISISQGTGGGYVAVGMSLRSAVGGGGKKLAWNSAAFSSLELAVLLSVGM